jgi:SAM-dependent methyltransferase
METERAKRLADFVSWVGANIRGDEKGEAQVYLDRFFQAFGHAGVREAGATLEDRVKRTDGKGTAFADLVWKPVVLIEMKKRGEDLTRHYRQAFDYWTRLVPGRPRYVILCNFDEFWVYDFDTQMDAPVDRIKLTELGARWGALGFLFPTPLNPIFGNDQVAVTRKAADQLADCFNKIVDTNRPGGPIDRPQAQRFVLQMLVALFAEDIGMLPRYMVAQLLDDCKTKQDSRDLIGGLFEAMNRPTKTSDDRYHGVDYFNGGLFAEPARLELRLDEVGLLKAASKEDWSKVRPEIFGALFEHSLGKEERHAFGAHFTHPTDIMKIVGPTIVEPWRKVIEEASTLKRLRDLWQRMQGYRVLDPACGSGNFLYIAYRELKRLEARLFERMTELSGRYDPSQAMFGFVSARQFFGMDINPFAVELAKVTMMIARKLAIDELHITERALPLDNLDENFRAADALVDELGNIAPWPRADVIIGNPPFLDARKLTVERGRDYVKTLEMLYPEVPRRADYCTYWIRRSHDNLAECTNSDPLTGRAGLVGTQNIRNNEAREGGLDHVVGTGTIVEAVENQAWSGEANVHVSIVNWIKSRDPACAPSKKSLWSKSPTVVTTDQSRRRGVRADKTSELIVRECASISASLSDETDVKTARILICSRNPKVVFEGVQTGHDGFVISAEEAATLKRSDRRNAKYLKPFLNGTDLLSGRYMHKREYVIDLSDVDLITASTVPDLLEIIKKRVLPDWQTDARRELEETGKSRGEHQNRLDFWWALKRPRSDLQRAIGRLSRYIACSAVMKRPTFVFLHSRFLPTNALKVFAFEDDYSFGILQSDAHWQWFVAKCSKLKSDFRYTPESVFDTFPWPQSPTDSQVKAVANAGRQVRLVRADALKKMEGGLRAVYRLLELPGKNALKDAQEALDATVLAAYRFSPKKDLLAQLLALNLEVARREENGEPVTSPGIPTGYPDPARLVTEDCIRAD